MASSFIITLNASSSKYITATATSNSIDLVREMVDYPMETEFIWIAQLVEFRQLIHIG